MKPRVPELQTLADLLAPAQTESPIGSLNRNGDEMFKMLYGMSPTESFGNLQRVPIIGQVHEDELAGATIVRPALFQDQMDAMPNIHRAIIRGSMVSLLRNGDLYERVDGRLQPRHKDLKSEYASDIRKIGMAGVVETLEHLQRFDFLKLSKTAPVVAATVLSGKVGASEILNSGPAAALRPIMDEINIVDRMMDVLRPASSMAAVEPERHTDKDTFLNDILSAAKVPEERRGAIVEYVTNKFPGETAVRLSEIVDATLEAAIYTSFDWSPERMTSMTKLCEGINSQGQFTESIQGLLKKNDSALEAIEAFMQKAVRTIEGPDRYSCIGSPAKLQDGRIQVVGQEELLELHNSLKSLVDRNSRGNFNMILGRNPVPNVIDFETTKDSPDMESAYHATAAKKVLGWLDLVVQQYVQGRASVQSTSPKDLTRFRAMRRRLSFQGGVATGILLNQLFYAMRGRARDKAPHDLLFQNGEPKLSATTNPWEEAKDPIFANTAVVGMQRTAANLGQVLPFVRASHILAGHLYRKPTPRV
jgi:hypothetical protein